ncbi:hypothetical protein [Paenibacillus nasutitermitis]|uniref:Uncharacterized protein n=1 Tax=Paenibacillus nasutitermitis TaxID=1652958 RepID=A0A916ZG23_9BACL|nr:hypothetical protein [Paenibacillus nasutitermitis]GGD95364.1 hypothetical protein GCM10010911_62590 [Paenibacillus nasutitermitis]
MNDQKTIYVLMTDTGTLFTRMIKLVTKAKHNHASIAFDPDLKDVYSFGRKQPRNPLSGGFVKEDIKGKLFGKAACAVYSCTINRSAYERMQAYIQTIEANQQDYKYNLIGLFGIILNMEVQRENAYFCTQFVAKVFEHSGLPIADKPASLVTPGDLESSAALRLEYQGELARYIHRQTTTNPQEKQSA